MGFLVIFNIELTTADIALIGKLLDEQPYKNVSDLVRRVQAQIDAQQAQPTVEIAATDEPVTEAA